MFYDRRTNTIFVKKTKKQLYQLKKEGQKHVKQCSTAMVKHI
jgi:hypothetical protein